MALRRPLYLLHLPLHRPHHLAGPTRPWEPPLERLKGAMELPSPLPLAPSAAPQEGRGGTPHIVRLPITIEYVGMTKIFKRGMITEGYCRKSVPDHQKEIYWERWKDPSIDEAIVRVAYDAKACVRYAALMHELRTLGVRPEFVTDEAWNRYRDYWASADFRARFEKASHNRKSEKGGPGTCPSKHTGGTRLWIRMKTMRSAQFHAKLVRRREEHTQTTPDQQIDEEQLYYDAAGVCPKGRVYRLGSLAKKTRRYADPGASTSQEPMVRRSEFDVVVQRLAQFEAFVQSQLGMRMDFGANTSHAPPPPPP
ncbi:hypothetical protein Scep_004952 [Stephania cephalantha]|uniref:Uncharacterized protein n=1 Tax=Stephania cephalantha TaxID=152367 RepID=A0AAP0PVW1_9MAGN